jgi:hypothetical protein
LTTCLAICSYSLLASRRLTRIDAQRETPASWNALCKRMLTTHDG